MSEFQMKRNNFPSPKSRFDQGIFGTEKDIKSDSISIRFTDFRQENLRETLRQIFKRLIDDEVLKIMQEDNSSSEFINARVNEIFSEFINNDREELLTKLSDKYNQLKEENMYLIEEKDKVNIFIIKYIYLSYNLISFYMYKKIVIRNFR